MGAFKAVNSTGTEKNFHPRNSNIVNQNNKKTPSRQRRDRVF